MKAAIYYRVSSQAQQEKESIETQKAALRPWLEEKGWDYTEFQDDGISGEELEKRPGFVTCIEALEDGQFQVLAVFQPDRIGRFKPYRDRSRVMTAITDNQINTYTYDGEDEDFYNPQKPEDMFRLEQELIDARILNYKQAKKIKAGHKRARLQGGFSGGKTPYGIRYVKHDKETRAETGKPGHFEIVPGEHETLEVMFNKLLSGWGLQTTADYLSQHPEDFPKRVRRYRGRLVTKWSDSLIQELVWKDFYFTGVIEPVKKNGTPVDTGIKLFSKDFIEAVRSEAQVKKKTSKYSPYIDCLLQGIAACGNCGWKIGVERPHRKLKDGTPTVYHYYRCKGRQKGHCDFKYTSAKKLDKLVWREFVEKLTDPEEVQRLILSGQFALDKSDEEVRVSLEKAKSDLEQLRKEKDRLLVQHQKGYIDDGQLDERVSEVGIGIEDAKARGQNYADRLRKPKEVEETVKLATEYVADQVKRIAAFQQALEKSKEKMLSVIQEILEPGGFFSAPLHELPHRLKQTSKLGKARRLKIKSLFASVFEPDSVLDITEDLDRSQVEKIIFQQKRALLQWFIDKEKAIVVTSPPGGSPEVNLSLRISPNLFYNFRNKE